MYKNALEYITLVSNFGLRLVLNLVWNRKLNVTDPVLRSACSWRMATMSVNRPLQVSQLGQLSLSSFRGR